jgi:hypothetical protein
MGGQCGQLELWSAPAGAARHNLFKHTLLGTARCNLAREATMTALTLTLAHSLALTLTPTLAPPLP